MQAKEAGARQQAGRRDFQEIAGRLVGGVLERTATISVGRRASGTMVLTGGRKNTGLLQGTMLACGQPEGQGKQAEQWKQSAH